MRPRTETRMKYQHVLALYPYFRDSTATMGLFPPVGLEYIATSIKDLVGKVTLLDLRYDKKYRDVKVLSDFIRNEIDLVCVSIGWNSQFDAICDLVGQLPSEVMTVVGGHKATEEVEFLFQALPEHSIWLCAARAKKPSWRSFRVLPLRRSWGSRIETANRGAQPESGPARHCADSFPGQIVKKSRLPLDPKRGSAHESYLRTVLTSRGCPFNCKFCTFSLNPLGQKRTYAERPLESVIEESKCITADVVMFSDENFFTNPKRSEQLCDLIIENGIKKKFIVQTRIEIAKHARLLEKAEKAGFKVLLIGIESPHDRIVRFNKGFTQQQVRKAFAILNRHDFYIHGYFIYGNMGETEEEMVYIARVCKELKLDSISFQKRGSKVFPAEKSWSKTPPATTTMRSAGPCIQTGTACRTSSGSETRSARFYNLGQIRRIAQKAFKNGLVKRFDGVRLCVRLPKLLFNLANRELEKETPAGGAEATYPEGQPRNVITRQTRFARGRWLIVVGEL